MQQFLQNIHTTHTHKFPSHMPLNWKLSFGPFSLSQNLLHSNLCLWPNPAWNKLNIKAQYFHVLSIFASRDEYYSKETSSQDAVGSPPRLPGSPEHGKMVVWPLFVFHWVTGKSASAHHCTMVALFSFPPVALPLCSVSGGRLSRMGVKETTGRW